MNNYTTTTAFDLEKLALVSLKTNQTVIITKATGEIEWVNDSFSRQTGYSLDEVIGKKPGHFLRGKETSKNDVDVIRAKLRSGKSFEHEILNYTKAGKKYWVNLFITPICDDEGVLTNFISVQVDITEKKKYQIELKKALEESKKSEARLAEALKEQEVLSTELLLADLKYKSAFKQDRNISDSLNKTKMELTNAKSQLAEKEKLASLGMLLAGIAHEMNNPLNFIYNGINALKSTISDYMELFEAYREKASRGINEDMTVELKRLLEDYEHEEIIEDIEAMTEDIALGAERTIEIVKGLRVFARTDDEDSNTVMLSELLESTLILLKNKYKHKIEVEKTWEKGLKPVSCFPGPLNQVLVNIINNAIQAIPEDRKDGKLVLKLYQEGDMQVISIKDNGTGIPKKVQEKIFQPFFTTKPAGIGTGLGMSISREIIIDKHKGDISFVSEEGKGTEFLIKLPAR